MAQVKLRSIYLRTVAAAAIGDYVSQRPVSARMVKLLGDGLEALSHIIQKSCLGRNQPEGKQN